MAVRKYDPEFKKEAIRMVLDDGRSLRSVENALGITPGLLKDWVLPYRKEKPVITDPTMATEKQLKLLQAEVERLRRERDILKKAVAIFSTEPDRYTDS